VVTVKAQVDDVSAPVDVEGKLVVHDPDGEQLASHPLKASLVEGTNTIEVAVHIVKPRLWWPAGMGAPDLYSLNLTLFHGSSEAQSYKRFGLRTVEVVQEPVEGSEGLSFYFRVNGIPVFAKGANMIPLHVFVNSVKESVSTYISPT